MRVDDFDFDLPDELIALRPARPRVSARLLIVEGPALRDARIHDLPQLLKPGDLLVLNDTRVIPARLFATRPARAEGSPDIQVELLLHRRESPDTWQAFARPAKRLRAGDTLSLSETLTAAVLGRDDEGTVRLRFNCEGAALDAAIAATGALPLPPYIEQKRAQDSQDRTDYQTAFARVDGAVAAPTAGLHFTPELLTSLEAAGITHTTVTLHVGAGTFLPVRVEDTNDHIMHAEWGEITEAAATEITAARDAGRRIVAVGTTSLRLLESAADAYGRVRPFMGETSIFITPGARLRTADLLLTNFHLPRSTLIMLVQAFGGVAPMRAAYAHAIARRYRFYSYGDACLISRAPS